MSEEKPFAIEYAKSGRSACKHCKKKIGSGELRVAKLLKNPFRSDPESSEKMRYWHHVDCIIEVFKKQRPKTKRINDPEEDVDGWSNISSDDKEVLVAALKNLNETKAESAPKKRATKRKTKSKEESEGSDDNEEPEPEPEPKVSKKKATSNGGSDGDQPPEKKRGRSSKK